MLKKAAYFGASPAMTGKGSVFSPYLPIWRLGLPSWGRGYQQHPEHPFALVHRVSLASLPVSDPLGI